jgi:aldehyde dehydrogenase (NAD+)
MKPTPEHPEIPRLSFNLARSYAASTESASHLTLKKQYPLFINGSFVAPQNGEYFPSINPSKGTTLAEFGYATATDVDAAVQAAREAHASWSSLSGAIRGRYLFRIARIIQERARELAILETMDTGKPIRESRDIDIPLVAAHFFYYAGWADKLAYAFPGKEIQSLGVAAQIIPWNFPLLMAAWKIAPALATGNTVVLKPAETTPLSAMILADILQQAELPKGVVNIITGDGKTGAALVSHPNINKVAFTGSTEVGKLLIRQLAGTSIPYTLELGGKAANIIFEDAAPDQAVEGIINGIFFNQGHVCCAGSRLLIQESVADIILQKLKDRIETLIVGDPLDKNTDIGAINSKMQLDKIQHYIELGISEGAQLYQPNTPVPSEGFYCKPTLFTQVSQSHTIAHEEIFGPVLAIQTFRTPDEAIEKANNTPYGLSGGVWTEKGSKIFKITGALKAGVVWGNTFNKFDPGSPFGGYKESGVGREGGIHGLQAYVRLT